MTMLPIWQDLDQDALDRAYDQAVWAPNAQVVMARYDGRSEATRQRLGAPRRLAYGAGAKEALDFFSCACADAPLLVFIHGGAWRAGSAQGYAFVAAGSMWPSGLRLCTGPGRTSGPAGPAGGERPGLAGRPAASLGVDSQRVHLVGHSSGAHLAAVVATGLDRAAATSRWTMPEWRSSALRGMRTAWAARWWWPAEARKARSFSGRLRLGMQPQEPLGRRQP